MRRTHKLLTMMSGGAAAAPTTLTLTCTTTGAQTLTLQGLTVAAGKTVTVDWGDTTSNTYNAGAGTRTHNYAGAGVWTVVIHDTPNITLLDLRDTKISGTINASNPLPAGLTSLAINYMAGLTYNANTSPLPADLTSLNLSNLAGLTYNANTNPLPAGLTSLYLSNLASLTWQINAAQPWPTGATAAVVTGCPNVTVSVWTDNAIRSARFENAWNQTNVDACVNAFWVNKANFTWALPSLDIAGGSNAAPSGVYQDATPPTTGKEKIYDLVNGTQTPAGPEWTVSYTP